MTKSLKIEKEETLEASKKLESNSSGGPSGSTVKKLNSMELQGKKLQNERWERLQVLESVLVQEPVQPVERIVVPVQGADREFEVQQWAAELAASLNVALFAIHIQAPGRDPPSKLFSYVRQQSSKWGTQIETRTVLGTSIAEELAQELEARDLVVIGTRRLASRYRIGSIAQELVARAPCPVVMVRLK